MAATPFTVAMHFTVERRQTTARSEAATPARSEDSIKAERPGAFPLVVSRAWVASMVAAGSTAAAVFTAVGDTAVGDTGKNLSI